MTVITLIRHGQTDWNLVGRIQGSTDIPLNETGRRQAAEAAAMLDISGPVMLAASDLSRAADTARLIGAARGWGEPTLFPRLRERGYGEAEGTLTADFAATFGDWLTARVPGAETRDAVLARALGALDELAAAAEGAPVVAVTHGALIGGLIRHLSPELVDDRVRVGNGSAHTFIVDDAGTRHVIDAAVSAR